jgi:hypothetical protein
VRRQKNSLSVMSRRIRCMIKIINHIYILPLLIATLLSIRSLRANWLISYRLFSVLLLCTLFVEVATLVLRYFSDDELNWPFSKSTALWYKVFLIPQYLFYMTIYYHIILSGFIKRMIVSSGVLFTLFAGFNILFFQTSDAINLYSVVMAHLIVASLAIIYFVQLLNQKEIIRLTVHPMIWISVGGFLFQISSLPYLIFINYLVRNDFSQAQSYYYIYVGSSSFMYSFYAIAFLCDQPIQKQLP